MLLGLTTGMFIILMITIVFGFYMAWTIGANDVANSMGTTYGSGMLSLRRIIIIAAIFEFLGAFLVGAHVTQTIKGGIVDPAYFTAEGVNGVVYYTGNMGSYVFIAGMLAVLLSAALWVTVATYKSLPISTSQSIVGAVVGFGVITVVIGEIPWGAINGASLIKIPFGWFASPIFGGVVSFFLFYLIKRTILNADEPVKRAEKIVPIFIFFVFFILLFAGMSGGLKNLSYVLESYLPDLVYNYVNKALGSIISIGIVSFVLAVWGSCILYAMIKRSKKLQKLESYDRIEGMFGMLLVFTACYVAFAHGANDVANAVGPLAAVWNIIFEGNIGADVSIPWQILVIGGIGIVVGVSTWGKKVMKTIGKKITTLTPTRGFSASFGAASSVLLCSMLGIPVSTSQIIVGCVIGVGFAGGVTAIDFRVVRNIVVSWCITIPIAAGTTMIIYMLFRGVLLIITRT